MKLSSVLKLVAAVATTSMLAGCCGWCCSKKDACCPARTEATKEAPVETAAPAAETKAPEIAPAAEAPHTDMK